MRAPVLRPAKFDALFRDHAARGEAHDLESSRVREDRPLPADERMEPARGADRLFPRADHQVIRVGQNRPAVPLLQPVELDSSHRAAGPHRQEARRLDHAVVRGQHAASRRRGIVAGNDSKSDIGDLGFVICDQGEKGVSAPITNHQSQITNQSSKAQPRVERGADIAPVRRGERQAPSGRRRPRR